MGGDKRLQQQTGTESHIASWEITTEPEHHPCLGQGRKPAEATRVARAHCWHDGAIDSVIKCGIIRDTSSVRAVLGIGAADVVEDLRGDLLSIGAIFSQDTRRTPKTRHGLGRQVAQITQKLLVAGDVIVDRRAVRISAGEVVGVVAANGFIGTNSAAEGNELVVSGLLCWLGVNRPHY